MNALQRNDMAVDAVLSNDRSLSRSSFSLTTLKA